MNNISEQKLRGGYYTPLPIAEFLIDWAINGSTSPYVLEPSMGDGVFIRQLAKRLLSKGQNKESIGKSILGVELFEEELEKAKTLLRKDGYLTDNFQLMTGDFFTLYKEISKKKYDIILGNPPFIRYQDFPENQRDLAIEILKANGFKPNKLTNSWLFFLLASVNLLNPNGRLAMVIPAEILQVKYAAEARVFLSKFFNSITIISFKKLVFDGIQQEVVLLLGDKRDNGNRGIDLIELNDVDDLRNLKDEIKKPEHFKPIDHSNDKWLQYYLSKEEILLIKRLTENKKLTNLGSLVNVDVGVVTGNNEFFVMNRDTINKYNLAKYVIPLVGRTAHLNGGVVFELEDWERSEEKGDKSYLLNYQDPLLVVLDENIKEYVRLGEEMGIHEGYKCRIRKTWYSVPSVWIPDAFLFRQIHKYPKIVENKARAIPTDTIHRVKVFKPEKTQQIASSFLNSLTFAFSEIYGRSYGGGVLELEPNEAEKLPIPYSNEIIFEDNKINSLLKKKNIYDALDYTDSILLKDYLGLSSDEIHSVRGIWERLSSRRINRN